MASGFTETGTCEVCGRPRKLRLIESGQRLCRGCFRELRPPRPKHLAGYATLETFRRRGIQLPDDATREQVELLQRQLALLSELVADVWYLLRRTSPTRDRVAPERIDQFSYDLVQTELGRSLAEMESARIQVGHEQLRDAWRAAEGRRHPTFEVLDGRLLDDEGRSLAYFNFKPPLAQDGTYWQLVALMRCAFPEYLWDNARITSG